MGGDARKLHIVSYILARGSKSKKLFIPDRRLKALAGGYLHFKDFDYLNIIDFSILKFN